MNKRNRRALIWILAAAALYAAVVLMNKRMQPMPALDRAVVQLLTAGVVVLPYALLMGLFSMGNGLVNAFLKLMGNERGIANWPLFFTAVYYLIANGLDFNEKWVISDRDEHGLDIDLVLPDELPDGFVCACDLTANRLIRLLMEKGYSVPEDVAVVGYDDYANNKVEGKELTTYHVNVEEMITQCMNMLEQHCENPDYRYGTVLSYGWLVERKTGRYHGK